MGVEPQRMARCLPGDPESAIERLKIALDLAPHDPLAFNSHGGIGCAHFKPGNYAEAATWQERALIGAPVGDLGASDPVPGLCARRAGLEARRSLGGATRAISELTLSEVQRGMPPLPPSHCDLVVGALNDAGLPA